MFKDNYRLYQIKKFLLSGNPKKDIIFVINNGNETNQEMVGTNVDFCRNSLEYLLEENGEFVQTRICSFKYYYNTFTLMGDWSSNKKFVNEKLGGILYKQT